jgi:hypothetical protein
MWLTSYDFEPRWEPFEVNLIGHASIGQRTDWAWATLQAPLRIDGKSTLSACCHDHLPESLVQRSTARLFLLGCERGRLVSPSLTGIDYSFVLSEEPSALERVYAISPT